MHHLNMKIFKENFDSLLKMITNEIWEDSLMRFVPSANQMNWLSIYEQKSSNESKVQEARTKKEKMETHSAQKEKIRKNGSFENSKTGNQIQKKKSLDELKSTPLILGLK